MKNPCEDTGYEMQRQERIDEMRFGEGLPNAARMPQQIERRDPWPNVPWSHYGPPKMGKGEVVLWVVFTCVVLVVIGSGRLG